MKKFIIITLVVVLIFSLGLIYLNKVILPKKIKSLIISGLEKQTHKQVTLKSLEFSIFRGLVLNDLVIFDSQQVILSARQAACTVFIWPIFKKQIIIPSITLKTPYIFLERRADSSFNLEDFFPARASGDKKSDFNVSVFNVKITSGSIVFSDETLPIKLRKEFKNIQFNLQLALPAKLKFNLKGEMPNKEPVFISAFGEYRILNPELAANITVKNLSTQEFQSYYNNLGDLITGLVDLEGKINFKNQMVEANITGAAGKLVLVKDKLKAKLNLGLQTKINYNLGVKKFNYSGVCDILEADILGVDFLGEIKNLHGKFSFNERSLTADSLKAELLEMPFEVKLTIKDFNTPALNIDTDFDLSFLPIVAKDKFKFSLINSASGKASLFIKLYPDKKGVWTVQGNAQIIKAGLKLGKQDVHFEDINAKIDFDQKGLSWTDTNFKFQSLSYQSSGTLSDFITPQVKFKLFSSDLSLWADIGLLNKRIDISELKGKYLDSQFLINGNIDNSGAQPQVDLNGKLNLDLGNLSKILDKQFPVLKTLLLTGQLDTQFNFSGHPVDFKNCYLQAKITSTNFSIYGLNSPSLALDFIQDQKIAKIPSVNISFYDGLIEGSGALNLDTPNHPYQLELAASEINLQKLNMDTLSKNKNISGTFQGDLKLDGFSNDLNKLSGVGSFSILKGRLWELNLLQGLGKLLFAKDLGNIELSECACAFLVKDKFIYTDKLKLKSTIADLYGPVKIGLDGSLEGAINVDILSDMVPLSGTLKDVTTAIIGQAGKFGVIKLSGTLKEPKYIFKPAVTNIIKGLTDVLFGK